jgi:hypothetical protein
MSMMLMGSETILREFSHTKSDRSRELLELIGSDQILSQYGRQDLVI